MSARIAESRLPRWMIQREIDQLQDKMEEAVATRDGMRLTSAVTRRQLNRRIERYEARMTELHQQLWDAAGKKCRVAECQERVDEHRAWEQAGMCLEHFAYATGASETPPPSPDVPPIALGSPWGDYDDTA